LYSGAQPTITNAGTFRKSAGTGITTTTAVFNNTGTVEVQKGTLSLEGGGTSSGTFDIDSDATLQFNGGTHVWNGAIASSGGGVLKIASGTVQADGAATLGSAVSISGGTLTGGGLVTFNGPASWSGGTISGTGVKRVAGGNTLTVDLSSNYYRWLDGTTLENQGTILYTGTYGYLFGVNGAILDNRAQGLIDLRNDHSFLSSGSTITNAGTFRKSASTGTTVITAVFNNTGTVDVRSGTLSLEGGGTSSGIFNISEGSNLQIGNSTVYTAGDILGAGDLLIGSSATLTADYINVGTLTIGTGSTVIIAPLSGGPLAGAGSFTAVPEPATWATLVLAAMGLGVYRRKS
jgi:hypothetical protein